MTKRVATVITGNVDRPTPIHIDDSGDVIDLLYGLTGLTGETGDGNDVYGLLPEGLYIGHEITVRRLPQAGISIAPNSPFINLMLMGTTETGDCQYGFAPNASAATLIKELINSLEATAFQSGQQAQWTDLWRRFLRAPWLQLTQEYGQPGNLVSPAFAVLRWTGKDWLVMSCTNSVQLSIF